MIQKIKNIFFLKKMKKKREIIIIIWGRKMNTNTCVQGDFLQCTFMRVLFKKKQKDFNPTKYANFFTIKKETFP